MALKLIKLDSQTLPSIADAIRAKTGRTEQLYPSDMAGAIGSIKSLRIESGTWTPAEDTQTFPLPSPQTGLQAIDICAADVEAAKAKGADTMIAIYGQTDTMLGDNWLIACRWDGSAYRNFTTKILDSAITVSRVFRAGVTYAYRMYYWEDEP